MNRLPVRSFQRRDTLARREGIFGYAFFVTSVGCEKYRTEGLVDHVLRAYEPAGGAFHETEEPFRWKTNSRQPHTSNQGSVWLGACLNPIDGKPAANKAYRRFTSHFGVSRTIWGEYRYNMIHMDGHVDDAVWKDPFVVGGGNQWCVSDTIPYGWSLETDKNKGVKRTPWTNGAFDCNK